MKKHLLTVAVVGSIVALTAFAADKKPAAAPAAADKAAAAPAAAPAAPTKWVVTTLADAKWMPLDPKNPKGIQISVVQGDPTKGPHTILLKMPAGSKSGVHSHTADYSAVVLQGTPTHSDTDVDAKPLAAGTTWFQPGKQNHNNNCPGAQDCISFISMAGPSDFIPAAPPPAPAKKVN